MKQATFAAGCFWVSEPVFRRVHGVKETVCGYCGGHTENPTEDEVSTGETGHAETVQVTYDPEQVSYDHLLNVFWFCHDPSRLNAQGRDNTGTQYRSVIFAHDGEQQAAAMASKDRLDSGGALPGRIVTEIVPASHFYPAGENDQRYLEKRGST